MNGTRQELMQILDEASAAMPTLRFGQLVANLVFVAKGTAESADIWDIEDEELLNAAREQLTRMREQTALPASPQ